MAVTLNAAMVLCAGLGTRMASPATNGVPKPLVELQGKALIDHVLDRIAAAGITRVVVNVHHMADRIERHLAGRRAPRIQISDERAALLDTGGGVRKALPLLGSSAFLVHNADCVWIEGVGSNLARLAGACGLPSELAAATRVLPVRLSLPAADAERLMSLIATALQTLRG